MNAKFTRTSLLLGGLFAAFAAHAVAPPALPAPQATTDQAVAAFERLLNHLAVDASPGKQVTDGAASGATSVPDPLLEHLVAALRPQAQ